MDCTFIIVSYVEKLGIVYPVYCCILKMPPPRYESRCRKHVVVECLKINLLVFSSELEIIFRPSAKIYFLQELDFGDFIKGAKHTRSQSVMIL